MNDENLSLNIKADLGIKADLEPVLNATPTGLKYIFNLLFGKKHAAAERMIRLADAQNEVDVKRIMAGDAFYDVSSGELIEATSEMKSPKSLVAEKIQDEEVSNLINCSVHAASYIRDNENSEVSDEPNEFINRWRNEAKLISSATAQAIWGRLLAEEVNSPGSISLRTIDVIKNLSKDEAIRFNEACKYVLFEGYIADNKTDAPVPAETFSLLRDSGLIVSYTPGMYKGSKWGTTKLHIPSENVRDVFYVRCGQFFIFVEKEELDALGLGSPSFSYWELTKAGRELYKVIRSTLDVEVTEIVKTLSEAGEDVVKKIKYTKYTDIEKSQVDTASIKGI